MKKLLFVALTMAVALPLSAQMDSTVLAVSGAGDMESLTEDEFERILSSRKVRLNASGRNRLLSSGLFSAYQVASIIDYRERCGDILSITELGSLDGFTFEQARRLSPLIDFSSDRLPGQRPRAPHLYGNALGRYCVRDYKGETQNKHVLKLKGEYGALEFAGAESRSYDGKGNTTFGLAWNGKRWLEKVVVGDYNLRFGQGLLQWSGFQMGSFQSVSSFIRRPTGLSLSTSSSGTGAIRGAAAEFNVLKRLSVVTFKGVGPDKDKAGTWSTWYGKNCQVSGGGILSGGKISASADLRLCIKGVDLAAECAAQDGSVSGWTASTVFPLWDRSRLAAAYRQTTMEKTAALGLETGGTLFTFDWREKKGEATYDAILKQTVSFRRSLQMVFRLKERYRPLDRKVKSDIRMDMVYSPESGLRLAARGNALWYRAMSWLGYAEAGYVRPAFNVYLRWTVYKVDNWDDRIYVYERDLPGMFTSPAAYGRACAVYLVGTYKFRALQVSARLGMDHSRFQLSWKF